MLATIGDAYPIIDWDGTHKSPILPGEVMYLDANELPTHGPERRVEAVASSLTSASDDVSKEG